MAFSDWSTTPLNNSNVPGINWAEGMLPREINNSARQMMADLAAWARIYGVSPLMFGADPTGDTDSTDAMKAFYAFLDAEGAVGMIPKGIFEFELDEVVIDNGFVTKPFITCFTAGYNTVFRAATNKNGAFLTISNGVATSGAGRFWEGGLHGGVFFLANPATDPVPYTDMDAIRMNGIEYSCFGPMDSQTIGGNILKIPRKLFGGGNPDPYHVNSNVFRSLVGTRIGGGPVNNDNYVGLAGNLFMNVAANDIRGTAFFGYGAGNTVTNISADCAGWAFDDNSDGLGGASNRFTVGVAELSTVQFGIRAARLVNSTFNDVRFTHDIHPATGVYWPRKAMSIGGVGAGVSGLSFTVNTRIDPGGMLADLGVFVDFNNEGGNITDVSIRHRLDDSAGLGVTKSYLYTNFNSNSVVRYTDERDNPIILTTAGYACGRAETTSAVPTGARAIVPYATELADRGGNYNAGTYKYKTPAYAVYKMTAKLALAMAVGDIFSMAFVIDGVERAGNSWEATDTAAHVYAIEFTWEVDFDKDVYVVASQDSGAPISITTVISAYDNQFEIEIVNA